MSGRWLARAHDHDKRRYLAPNGATYRLVRYEVPIELMDTGHEREVPVYHYWSPDGGAAGGIYDLPEGCVRVVLPTPDRPALGPLFLAPDGTVYRLRSYLVDWNAEPFTGEETKPFYRGVGRGRPRSGGW